MLQSKTKCDQIVEEITSKILKGEYKENEVLQPESYFVDYFGVGRGTIREAFKKLNTLGLVTIKQGRGTIVNRVSLGNLMHPLYSAIVFNEYNAKQIYDVRAVLEAGVAGLAAMNSTEKDKGVLEELADAMLSATQKRDSSTFSKLDIRFHEYIVEMADNEVLKIIYNTINDIINKYIVETNFSLEVISESAQCHYKICEAIVSHNPDEARYRMRRHIEVVKEYVLEQIEKGMFPIGIH